MCTGAEIVFGLGMVATAVSGGISAYNSYEAGKAQKRQAEASAQEMERQARVANEQSAIAQMQGEQEQERRSRALAAELGQLRAEYAGNGLMVDSGRTGDTLGQIESSAMREGYEDIATIGANTKMNVWGLQEKSTSLMESARQTRMTGREAKRAGTWSAIGTGIGTAGTMATSAGTYYSTGDNWKKSMFNSKNRGN